MYRCGPGPLPPPCKVICKVTHIDSVHYSLADRPTMLLRSRSQRPASRGQAMVEFALVLPVLALLLVMAVDFGRVFFGSVALHNAARIAADRAAQTADAWPGSTGEDTTKQEQYVSRTEADLEAINCTYPPIPDPEFPGGKEDGDPTVVSLECSFDLITPLAENLLGGPVQLGAQAEFPIHRVVSAGIPDPPPPAPTCADDEGEVPAMVGQTLGDARDMWEDEGFDKVNFTPTVKSTGPPAGRNVNKIVQSQATTPVYAEGDCAPLTISVNLVLMP